MLFDFKNTDIHLLYIVGVYFGKAVTISFSVSHQKSLHKLLMVNRRQKATHHQVKSTALLCARVSMLLVLRALWSILSMIRCIAYSMCRMTQECCTSNRMCGLHQPLCCLCVCVFLILLAREKSSYVSREV